MRRVMTLAGVLSVAVPTLIACGPSDERCDDLREVGRGYSDQYIGIMNQMSAIIRAGGTEDNPEYQRLESAARSVEVVREQAWDAYFDAGCQ